MARQLQKLLIIKNEPATILNKITTNATKLLGTKLKNQDHITAGLLGATASNSYPWHDYALATKKFLSSSTVAGIVDMSNSKGEWFVRFDKAHRGYDFPHINIRHKFTGCPDPHTQISETTLSAVESLSSIMISTSSYLVPVAISLSTSRIIYALYQDFGESGAKRSNSNTVETVLPMGAAYGAGTVGHIVGAKLGGMVGTGFGFLAGGPFVTPCAAVGTMAGGLLGGVTSALKAHKVVKTEIRSNAIKLGAQSIILNVEHAGMYSFNKLYEISNKYEPRETFNKTVNNLQNALVTTYDFSSKVIDNETLRTRAQNVFNSVKNIGKKLSSINTTIKYLKS